MAANMPSTESYLLVPGCARITMPCCAFADSINRLPRCRFALAQVSTACKLDKTNSDKLHHTSDCATRASSCQHTVKFNHSLPAVVKVGEMSE